MKPISEIQIQVCLDQEIKWPGYTSVFHLIVLLCFFLTYFSPVADTFLHSSRDSDADCLGIQSQASNYLCQLGWEFASEGRLS